MPSLLNKLFIAAVLPVLFLSAAVAADVQRSQAANDPAASGAAHDAWMTDVEKSNKKRLRALLESLDLNAMKPAERRAVILQKVSVTLPDNLRKRLEADPAFAGKWVRYEPEPLLIFAFAGEDGYARGAAVVDEYAAKAGGFWVDYVEVRQAPISQAELIKLRDQFENALRANGILYYSGIGLDRESKSHLVVEIEVTQPVETVEAALRKAGIKVSPFVKVIQVPVLPVPF